MLRSLVEQFAKINSAKYQFLETSIAKINSAKINARNAVLLVYIYSTKVLVSFKISLNVNTSHMFYKQVIGIIRHS